jgi:hypothetical protein
MSGGGVTGDAAGQLVTKVVNELITTPVTRAPGGWITSQSFRGTDEFLVVAPASRGILINLLPHLPGPTYCSGVDSTNSPKFGSSSAALSKKGRAAATPWRCRCCRTIKTDRTPGKNRPNLPSGLRPLVTGRALPRVEEQRCPEKRPVRVCVVQLHGISYTGRVTPFYRASGISISKSGDTLGAVRPLVCAVDSSCDSRHAPDAGASPRCGLRSSSSS